MDYITVRNKVDLQTISSLGELRIPDKYKSFLRIFLTNAKCDTRIGQVILFGSCACGSVSLHSDIDIAVLGEHMDDEDYIRITGYFPSFDSDVYIEYDLVTMSYEQFHRHRDTVGYVQRHIVSKGVDISGII